MLNFCDLTGTGVSKVLCTSPSPHLRINYCSANGCRPITRAKLLEDLPTVPRRRPGPGKEPVWSEFKRKIKIKTKLYYGIYKHIKTLLQDLLVENKEEVACNPVEMKIGQIHIKPPSWWTFVLTIFILASFFQAKLLYLMLYLRMYI